MRLLLLLAFLLSLVPEGTSWRAVEECCDESCACGMAEQTCCEPGPDGPLIVALCDCGEDHAPHAVHRASVDWLALPAATALVDEGRRDAAPADERRPRSHTSAPEPPPPRRAGGRLACREQALTRHGPRR